MNYRGLVIGFVVGVVLLVGWGEWRYRQGRNTMRAEMLALRPTRDTVFSPVIVQPPPDTMRGGPRVGVIGPTLPVAGRSPAGAVDVRSGEIIDESGGSALAMVYVDTLTDSRGGSHRVTFTYPALNFNEIYTPGPDTGRVVTVTETRYVPAEGSDPAFWFAGHAGINAGGASIGWRSFGVGRMWLTGAAPVTFITYQFRF